MQMCEAIKVIAGLLNIFFSKIIKLNGNTMTWKEGEGLLGTTKL